MPEGSASTKPNAEFSDPAAIYLNYVDMSAGGSDKEGSISSTNATGIRVENGRRCIRWLWLAR
ncbi:MAG: hypothetical protein ACI90U_000098 [Pseudomonadales bacterium]|jgi:hypothetical protein